MKNKYIIAAATISVMMAAQSCTLINSGKKTVAQEPEAYVPQDRDIVVSAPDSTVTEVNANKKADSDLTEGCIRSDWAIQTVMGKRVEGIEAPYLKFELKTRNVYGNNGCNTLNAKYTYNPADSTIQITSLLTTMRACPDTTSDVLINQALDQTRRYTWYQEGANHYIVLLDKNGKEMLTLMHQDFEFLNGTWKVEQIDGQECTNPDVQLVIDIDEMKIHGNTGCNLLNGKVEANLKSVNSISFHSIGVTRRACPDMDTEKDLLVALEEAMYARPDGEDRVILLNDRNRPVLTMVRATVETED